jgi:hypothetical protein
MRMAPRAPLPTRCWLLRWTHCSWPHPTPQCNRSRSAWKALLPACARSWPQPRNSASYKNHMAVEWGVPGQDHRLAAWGSRERTVVSSSSCAQRTAAAVWSTCLLT